MKKVTLASFVFVLVLSFVIAAQAEFYTTDTGIEADGYFTTRFWKEKFIGGGPGAPGNVLMAIGQGFVFQNAVLEKVEPLVNADNIVIGYATTYTGGRLTLNPRGPWLNKKKYQAIDIVATNVSSRDDEGNLLFTLTFLGTDEKAGVTLILTVDFHADAENYEIKYDEDGMPDFHRGFDFDADIDISEISDVLP